MKQKISALLLTLVFLALTSCAPSSTEKEDATKQPELPPNALETETSEFPETQTDPVETPNAGRFDSKLGCSFTYDPTLFTVEETEDENLKSQSIEFVTCLTVHSIWENSGFPVCVSVTPLDASSVEEAVNDMYSSMNLDDGPAEDAIFGSGNYAATHLTYNKAYTVGEIYVTEQNGTVFEVKVSSYYQPPEELLAHAYDILNSITF